VKRVMPEGGAEMGMALIARLAIIKAEGSDEGPRVAMGAFVSAVHRDMGRAAFLALADEVWEQIATDAGGEA
jgi:hypothetical protein